MPKKKINKPSEKKFNESEAYQELISSLAKTLKEAKEKGLDLTERLDVLRCRCCGAYEDIAGNEGWGVYINRIRVKEEKFIVTNRSVRCRTKNGMDTYWAHYQFICSICGFFQKETIKKDWPAD